MKENLNEILELSSLVFEDKEISFVEKCIKENKFNALRLFIEDHILILKTILEFEEDSNLREEFENCVRLEDVVMDCIVLTT